MKIYIMSSEQPGNLSILHDQFDKEYGRSLTFISDPQLELISNIDMQNGTVAYRGYAVIDSEGNVVLKKVDDYWGGNLTNVIKDIKETI